MDEITQQLFAPAKELAQDGINCSAYITELTWLLFLKIAPDLDEINYLFEEFNWENLLQKDGIEQYDYYKQILTALAKVIDPHVAGIYTHANTVLQNPEQLQIIITALNKLDDSSIDELGELYEDLLALCDYEKDGHLYIAPRALIDMMVRLTQPEVGEFIQDPYAGVGNFIVAADQYIQVIADEEIVKTTDFIAIEPDLIRQRLGLMNCLLHKIEHPQHVPIRWGDSLLSNRQIWPPADIILSTLISNNDTALALLKHIYQTLKPNGRAAIIVPDTILATDGPAQEVRKNLLENTVLHTVLRLPHGILYPDEIDTHVLFFYKSTEAVTENVWFYDARNDLREHLINFETVYGDDPYGLAARQDQGENGRLRCFSREYLAQHDDRLNIEIKRNQDLVDDAILKETLQDLQSLKDLL
ncbi:HsdM family class I SAM-dependent methyltransferase [Candidatus Marithrix sp. Canyon 246]|uniref:HsdM family class I SAM-dependent methyltransferase n=1 Tax=Candidatus Marithrix sp. Canyon 246 TaxID=1827136 RepID=UPI00084A0A94|nr:N-6 DNA methylase [Candidatus Marithrix sp. Canyon 246]